MVGFLAGRTSVYLNNPHRWLRNVRQNGVEDGGQLRVLLEAPGDAAAEVCSVLVGLDLALHTLGTEPLLGGRRALDSRREYLVEIDRL